MSQTALFTPDSTAKKQLWRISKTTELYVGASFYYIDPSDSIVVWLDTSESDITGDLYVMVPGYSDSAMFLFSNKDIGTRINITKVLSSPIIPGTEIFFMYKRRDAVYPKFTGQNRKNLDPADKSSYPGAEFVAKEFDRRPGYGYRWSVAGRIIDASSIPTDTAIFGFEDMINLFSPNDTLVISDRDFNDVIFRVTGLNLNVEKTLDSIQLLIPDSVIAGDEVICSTKVWFDSSGQKITIHNLDSMITWKLSGFSINRDTLIPGTTVGTSKFLPRTAFESFVICASLINPKTHDTVSTCKTVRVYPGKPDHLSIELRADTASSDFNRNNTIQIGRVLIPSNTMTQSIYAIFRDKFGNFAGFSPSTVWDTSSTSSIPGLTHGCVSVSSGQTNVGEGIVSKITSGNLLVFAKDIFDGKTLKDTVIVNVPSAIYDSLRIGKLTNSNIKFINSLTTTTDSCTHLEAQGRRVDNGKWESLRVSWRSPKWHINTERAVFSGLDFCPQDTGNGFLEIQYDGYLKNQISINAKPGAPQSLRLYTDAGKSFPSDTFVQACKPLVLHARIFDKNGIWIKSLVKDSIFWNFTDDTTVTSDSNQSAFLNTTNGETVKLNPIRAYRTVNVRANFYAFSDTVNISIHPGDPYRVVIESHANWHISLHAPDEIDTIEIPDNSISASVFALLRDSVGNYIDSVREGSWSAADTIIKIQSGKQPCHGIITKNLQVVNGVTPVMVTSGTLSDTAFVKLLPYHFTAIRITDINHNRINNLTMSTNQDTTLKVQGLRSDTTLWRDIMADWSKTDSLSIDPACPLKTSSFTFSPVKPGNGVVAVQYNSNDTLRDTINVTFKRGDPVKAEIDLLTSPEKLIAGDTIYACIKIFNKDGLVPGEFCSSTDFSGKLLYYTDQLGYGDRTMKPVIFSALGNANINKPGTPKSGLKQCFSNGKDTVGMVLYYAPFNKDSLHRIMLQFGSIQAYSNPFRLKPSYLDSLSLAHTHKCCKDSLVLRYPDEQALIYAIGYDKYGNMRGGELCTWRTTGTLHECDTANSLTRIEYSADSAIVDDDESGNLIAVSVQNASISDTLRVVIIGPLAKPVNAVTKDLNGNGLLDRIEIRFDMPVYKNSKHLLSYFSIYYNNSPLSLDSFSISKDSMNLTLFLNEYKDTSMLQTGWTPVISFQNVEFALGGAVDSFNIETFDGAGPVIKSVVKEIKNENRNDDVVTITFSEKITGPNGSQFSFIEMPERVFTVYTKYSNSFKAIPILSGIKHFNAPVEPNFVLFNTSNGNDLSGHNYLNIRTDKGAYIIEDLSGNIPSKQNRKVQVQIKGTVKTELLIAPNPSRPSFVHEKPGEFHLVHNPQAVQWVAREKAGVAIIFPIQLTESHGTVVGGQIVILDMIGNKVIADPETDYKFGNLFNKDPVVSNQKHLNIIPSAWRANGSIYEYVIYWNGYTKDKLKAAPGVYRAILKLYTKSGQGEKVTTFVGKIGIKP